MTELERIEQAEEYFNRYYQMENAITQNRENEEYLRTYIHDEEYVIKNFDLAKKRATGVGIAAGIGLVLFLLLWLITGSLIVGIVLGAFGLLGFSVFAVCLQHYRLDEAKKQQVEVNQGINEQIEILKAREPQLIRTKDDYYKGLEKRIDFMSLNDMKYIGEMKKWVQSGEAQTAEDAAAMLEQKMLMEQFNSIMKSSEMPVKTYTDEENKERFGDPLEFLKKKKKFPFGFGKKKKEK